MLANMDLLQAPYFQKSKKQQLKKKGETGPKKPQSKSSQLQLGVSEKEKSLKTLEKNIEKKIKDRKEIVRDLLTKNKTGGYNYYKESTNTYINSKIDAGGPITYKGQTFTSISNALTHFMSKNQKDIIEEIDKYENKWGDIPKRIENKVISLLPSFGDTKSISQTIDTIKSDISQLLKSVSSEISNSFYKKKNVNNSEDLLGNISNEENARNLLSEFIEYKSLEDTKSTIKQLLANTNEEILQPFYKEKNLTDETDRLQNIDTEEKAKNLLDNLIKHIAESIPQILTNSSTSFANSIMYILSLSISPLSQKQKKGIARIKNIIEYKLNTSSKDKEAINMGNLPGLQNKLKSLQKDFIENLKTILIEEYNDLNKIGDLVTEIKKYVNDEKIKDKKAIKERFIASYFKYEISYLYTDNIDDIYKNMARVPVEYLSTIFEKIKNVTAENIYISTSEIQKILEKELRETYIKDLQRYLKKELLMEDHKNFEQKFIETMLVQKNVTGKVILEGLKKLVLKKDTVQYRTQKIMTYLIKTVEKTKGIIRKNTIIDHIYEDYKSDEKKREYKNEVVRSILLKINLINLKTLYKKIGKLFSKPESDKEIIERIYNFLLDIENEEHEYKKMYYNLVMEYLDVETLGLDPQNAKEKLLKKQGGSEVKKGKISEEKTEAKELTDDEIYKQNKEKIDRVVEKKKWEYVLLRIF